MEAHSIRHHEDGTLKRPSPRTFTRLRARRDEENRRQGAVFSFATPAQLGPEAAAPTLAISLTDQAAKVCARSIASMTLAPCVAAARHWRRIVVDIIGS